MKTLKGKISLVYIALVALIALVGGISVTNLIFLQRSVNGLITENYTSISTMEQARAALNKVQYAVIKYMELNNEAGLNDYAAQVQVFDKAFQTERGLVTEQGEQDIVNTIDSDTSELKRQFAVFQNIRDMKGKPVAEAYYKNSLEPQFEKIQKGLNTITTLNENAMFRKKNEVSANAENSFYMVLLITIIAVAGGYFPSRYLINRMLKPIQLLTDSISRVKAGKLDTRLDIKTGDETEKLIQEFNNMIERLSAYEKSTLGTLMEEKNKSVSIVKSISDPLIVLDKDYKVVMVNDACERFFDLQEEQVRGRHLLEAVRSSELFGYITESMESQKPVSEKVLSFEKDRSYYFNVTVTKRLSADEALRGCIVLMQNVTGFKEIERIKTDFVATVSHEFKTPLTSIIMGASMLEGGNPGALNKEQREIVGAILEDGEKLSGFVTELLEISRLESGRAVYSFEPCSISAIAETSVRQFVESAERRQVTLTNEVDEGLPPVYADFERVTWVLNNLLSNALKYTTSGDFITVNAEVKGGTMEVTVKDTGDGIPAEYLDRIFDKFVQLNGHEIEARGTGLGLAVAKEIITAHQGEIRVESELDAGSTFRFTLPLAKHNR